MSPKAVVRVPLNERALIGWGGASVRNELSCYKAK